MDQYYPFPAYPLPYSYVSLIPSCDADTLYAHHQYYLGGVSRLNHMAARAGVTDRTLEQLITQELNLPEVTAARISDLAGMTYNHELYFSGISADAAPPPDNALTRALTATYGSLDKFRELLIQAAQSLLGSGWLWLILEGGGLHLALTSNNETVSLAAVTPIFVIDLWEHSYFPIHRFDKAAYLNDWFQRVDWAQAERNFLRGRETDNG